MIKRFWRWLTEPRRPEHMDKYWPQDEAAVAPPRPNLIARTLAHEPGDERAYGARSYSPIREGDDLYPPEYPPERQM